MTDDGHLMLVCRRFNRPIGLLATNLHHKTQRFADLIIALQADIQIIIANGCKRVDAEAKCLCRKRSHIVGNLTIDQRKPLRQILQRVVFDCSSLVDYIDVE